MLASLSVLDEKYTDLKKQVTETREVVRKCEADDELYRQMMVETHLRKNLQALSQQRRVMSGKLSTELNGLCDSAKAHLEKIRILESNNRWQDKQYAKLTRMEYVRAVVYDSYRLCHELTTDIEQ